ncbi:MAG: GNAT family protein [Crocinitomicaceae bacterium]|nr:GNAT family protein [Crocinitomicaceae bacterium]
MLEGNKILLRVVEPNDATLLFIWENRPENKKVTNADRPIDLFFIRKLIDSQRDVYLDNQLRFIICLKEDNAPIGTVDLFDVDFNDFNSKIGILIAEKKFRNKGYACEAIKLIISYCRNKLDIITLNCCIQEDNLKSIKLFEKNGFKRINNFNNILTYKLCLKKD